MASSSSGICWPSRFPLRLTAFFLGALVVGMLLGVLLHKAPKPAAGVPVQGLVYTYGSFSDAPEQRVAAICYYTDEKGVGADEGKRIDSFRYENGRMDLSVPGVHSNAPGIPVAFNVQLVDSHRSPIGKPVYWPQHPWVTKDKEILEVHVRFPFPKPTNLGY